MTVTLTAPSGDKLNVSATVGAIAWLLNRLPLGIACKVLYG